MTEGRGAGGSPLCLRHLPPQGGEFGLQRLALIFEASAGMTKVWTRMCMTERQRRCAFGVSHQVGGVTMKPGSSWGMPASCGGVVISTSYRPLSGASLKMARSTSPPLGR